MTLEEKLHKELDWLEIKHIDADGIIRNILSIIQQEIADAKPKWISVKDRLPEKGQQVLAYNPTDKEEPFWVDYLFLNANKELRWDMGVNEVTHWMPLPESPKEKL